MAELFASVPPAMAWLTLGAVLILLELVVGSMFLLWPGAAALIFAGVVWAAPDLSLAAQLAAFAGLSIALGFLGRGVFNIKPRQGLGARPELNRVGDQLVGRRVTAAEAFSNGAGQVTLGDTRWSARLADPSAAAEPGAFLTVTAVEGARLVVTPLEAARPAAPTEPSQG